VARHALRDYHASEIPTDHIPTRTIAAKKKFADVLEFLEAESV